jgi:hypothetical protein
VSITGDGHYKGRDKDEDDEDYYFTWRLLFAVCVILVVSLVLWIELPTH